MDKISIIIPIYNVEDYLPECLDSVINQTYQNLEIILVNDGATDSCAKICDEYALKDNRIKVIHKPNGGLSDARNAGLNVATGNFISFVDSDDLVAVDFCEKLLHILIENNADIAECGFYKFETDLDLVNVVTTPDITAELFETEIALELLMKEYLKQMVWNKLYRKEVMAQLQFPVDKINEDEYWTYKVFGNAKKIVKIQNIIYFYRQQEASIMGKNYSLKRLDGLRALEERISYMKENFPKLKKLAIKKFCLASLWHYQQVEKNKEIDPQKIFRKKIFYKAQQYNQLSILKNWKLKEIIAYQLFIWSPKFYMKLREVLYNRLDK